MSKKIRKFLFFEGATFLIASLIHSGRFVAGYEHHEARIAEGIIGGVLVATGLLTSMRPAWTRRAGMIAQGFALLGTLVGLFTIAIGVGPRTVPDVVYHLAIVGVLIWGLLIAMKAGETRRLA